MEAVGLPSAASHRRRFVVKADAAAALIDALPEDTVTAHVVRTYLKPSKRGTLSSVTKKCAAGRADTLVYRVQTGGGRQVGPVRFLPATSYEAI